jgi:2-dehydro-3-deoxyphosphogluconate aldolase/(4S)-4-hydroxy-2-oxoglutarate aldolase
MSENRRDQVAAALARDRLIPIIRSADRRAAVARLEAIAAAGAAVIELTATIPSANDLLREYAESVPALGLGSIRSDTEARAAIDAGAAFLVTPGVLPTVIEQARAADAFVIVGGFTPTEIITAWDLGADAVKWFPASIGGVRALRDLRAPLPHIPLIPTGGVDRSNAENYLAAGAFAVGVGSALSDEQEDVTDATREWLALCRATRPPTAVDVRPRRHR